MTTATPSVLLRGLSRGQLIACDAGLAIGVAVVGWIAALEVPVASSHAFWHEPAWVSALAGLLLGVPVAMRRLRPEVAAWSAILLCALVSASGLIPDYAGLAPTLTLAFVLYTVGTDVGRRRSVTIILVGIAVLAAAFGSAAGDAFEVGLVLWVLGACWTTGRTIRERRAYAARSVAQATELALGEERLRIARDLHDIVAHNMSVIAVRATVADHIADLQPQQMRESLRDIAVTSREALAELRRALGALRAEAVVVPTPGLSDLEGVVAAARSTGLVVEFEVRGDREIPEGVGVAVFRLVQEALTNVLKHARATRCRIRVDLAPGEVWLEVTDDGIGALGEGRATTDDGRAGQGLIGMRERAAMFGGDLTAGPGEPASGTTRAGAARAGATRAGAARAGAARTGGASTGGVSTGSAATANDGAAVGWRVATTLRYAA
ncbi:sensor histidine kinase [Actinoplanes sp. CA-030573]|uniref:sensor histidine kinase n=1 Tax=Actinoplanes sp. CA-030573 TaxID=3239898 RepID=UPI003D8AF6AC